MSAVTVSAKILDTSHTHTFSYTGPLATGFYELKRTNGKKIVLIIEKETEYIWMPSLLPDDMFSKVEFYYGNDGR